MRKLSYVVILLGIVILLTPKIIEWRADMEQDELLKRAESQEYNKEHRPAVLKTSKASSLEKVSRLLNEGENGQGSDQSAGQSDDSSYSEDEHLIGTITIDSIDVKLPILEGATKENMSHAAVHLPETSWFGETGNAAIAAHRAHKAGRLFNRLNEVSKGDKIVIKSGGKVFTYTVYKKWIVLPTEVSVLDPVGQEKLLTLITCDPLINPTHRLIVQAKEDE
ncbi:class D sortase [Paenibacillus sp. J22TS3]|uniref:class D sortase n=1 Tax=Paenibacillus sp. J22TS3 TaxID=2807192 RepID=UPI001B004218|nr:class D sortase [Paenibacillus sp. J22TS3]GIP23742.1 class C sortase [Paenibacillus sp. J22TS3]